MKPIVQRGATSIITHIFVQDSASTTGGGKTGLTNSSAGLIIAYIRPGEASVTAYTQAAGNIETITTIGTYQAPTASKIRFKEVDATNFPGLYEIHAADSVYNATGTRRSVSFIAFGAAGMAPVPWERQLTGSDIDDGVRAGLTALPNAAAGATGGLAGPVAFGGTASAGTATSITLAGAVATDNYYNHQLVVITAGTGAGQARIIAGYVGSTKIATVSRSWATNPDNTSVFQVIGMETTPTDQLFAGMLTAATATTITLPTGASTVNNFYNGALAVLTAGTGQRQSRIITGYVGGTLVATLDRAWATTPDNTTVVVIYGADQPAVDASLSVPVQSGTGANQISLAAGLVTLAGVTHTGAVIPTVTTLTNAPLDSSGTTTLLSRLSAGRATNLDNLDAAVSTRLATAVYTAPPSAASISTTVWTEPIPGAFGAGSAGAKLNSAGSAGDPWATALPGAYGAGTAGNIVGNRLDAAVSTRLATSGYTAPLDAATTKAQVTAVISTDARAEPSAVPAANASLGAKVDFMFAKARNKLTQTATTQTLRNSGDTANIGTNTDSFDGTTLTRGGWT